MTPHLLWFVDGIPSLAWVAVASAQAAVLIVIVLALRVALGRHLTPGWRLALWTIVLLRLVVPLAVESRWSFTSLARRATWIGTRPDVAAAGAKPRAADGPHVSVTYGPIPGNMRDTVAKPEAAPDYSRVTPIDSVADVWLAGIALLVAWQVGQAIRLRRAIGRMRPVDDASLLTLAARCAREIGVRRRVGLVETDRLRAPAVCGIVRPTVLLPIDVTRTLSPAELRLVLLHELAHVRRNDAFVAAIARLVRAVHWFNPFVWIGVRAFRVDRELACDAAVLRIVGDGERLAYGECLLHVVARVSGLPRHPATLGLFGSSRHLQRRIDMIAVRPSRGFYARCGRVITGGLIVVALGCAAAVGEPRRAASTRPADVDAAATAPRVARVVAESPSTTAAVTGIDRAQSALDASVGVDVDFDATPFAQAIERLRSRSGAPIFVNWTMIEASGVPRATPVTLRLPADVKFGKTLSVLLQAAGGGHVKLAYSADEGVIVISTRDDVLKNVCTRTYDIRDLLIRIPDSSDADEKPTRANPIDRDARVTQLIDLIQQTIEPDDWKSNGGLVGAVQEISGQLVVTNTSRAQGEIDALLRRLREGRSVQVNVEARFVAADPARLTELLGDRAAATIGGAKQTNGVFLDDASAAKFLRAVQLGEEATTLTAPTITLFNGQRALVKVARPQAYIADFTLTQTAAGERKFEPRIQEAVSGITLGLGATVSADRHYATLTLEPQLSRLVRLDSEPFAGDPKSGLSVQRPTIETQEMRTTVSVPDRGTLLLSIGQMSGKSLFGGMPFARAGAPLATTRDSPQQLLLMVRPTVITQREAEPTTSPQPAK